MKQVVLLIRSALIQAWRAIRLAWLAANGHLAIGQWTKIDEQDGVILYQTIVYMTSSKGGDIGGLEL